MKMFEDIADEIFAAAHVIKIPDSVGKEDGNMWVWDQVVTIMSRKMASLSHLGLVGKKGAQRVRQFEEQKQALIQDLIDHHGGHR